MPTRTASTHGLETYSRRLPAPCPDPSGLTCSAELGMLHMRVHGIEPLADIRLVVLPNPNRSYAGSEASVPFLRESFLVNSPGGKFGRTLSHAPAAFGQRGQRPEVLQASASVPSNVGGHASLSVQTTREFPSPSYSETPSSPPPRDRFDADMKLAQLNFDQRTEMRQMVNLSSSALNELVGLTAEELNIADDDEDEDELEAEAAILRKKASTKHYYEASLKSYRVRSCAPFCLLVLINLRDEP